MRESTSATVEAKEDAAEARKMASISTGNIHQTSAQVLKTFYRCTALELNAALLGHRDLERVRNHYS